MVPGIKYATRTHFAHLLSCSATAARILFEIILDRLADTEAHLRQRERMAQLGTLTAGVAHELNNPAAAVARAANQLSDAVHTYARFAAEAAATLDEPGREAILQRPQTPTDSPQELSALERADREQEIEGALADAGLDEPWLYSLDLAALGIRAADLDHIRDDVGGGDLPAALRAIGSARTVDMLLRTVLLGSHRLSVIVKALKSYSYLDQAPLQDIDVTVGIEDTLLILASTLEGIHVERDYAEDLRTIEAHGSELNQVWTNLLSNAIDAITERRSAGDARAGRITISVHNTDAGIAVEITDNGIGIPPEVTGRVFDSFFTTKAPGKGTGIGLDISRQIVTLGHGGDISVQSEPGHTTFRVELPAQPVDVGTTTTRSSLEVP